MRLISTPCKCVWEKLHEPQKPVKTHQQQVQRKVSTLNAVSSARIPTVCTRGAALVATRIQHPAGRRCLTLLQAVVAGSEEARLRVE